MSLSDFGMVGLGVMGQNLVLNLERNGLAVSVYGRTAATTEAYLKGAAAGKRITGTWSLEELVASIARPRRIMLLVKAGEPVDAAIASLLPLLDEGDLVIDGGNSHFTDTERRARELAAKGFAYIGMGVSGGEEGALFGPSLMPGGSAGAWPMIEDVMTKVAAKASEDGAPCVAWIGPGGAGHYVKMVHNGIEYGDMQLIAEAYDILHRVGGLSAAALRDVFAEWNRGPLASYLIEVTAQVLGHTDAKTGLPMVDLIKDAAGQKGTGKWTVQDASSLGASIPTIAAAVDARALSSLYDERQRASRELRGPATVPAVDADALVAAVHNALYASKICSYAQGLQLLRAASDEYGYGLDLAAIAKLWRAGCIIRADFLNDIARAFTDAPALPNLLLDAMFRDAMGAAQDGWRRAVQTAVAHGIPVPAMSGSLAYYDSYRSARLPANLIQAQRDFFGAHTFERLDLPGIFHEDWNAKTSS
jgi:6-phosphogluconate dehydrogenase